MEIFKYQSTGNDFILFKGPLANPSKFAIKVCDRHFGIGADGILYSTPSKVADIKMNYYNADGSIAPMCGNGLRAFAHFVTIHKLVNKKEFVVETLAGLMKVKKLSADTFSLDLGKPTYALKTPNLKSATTKLTKLTLKVDNQKVELYPIFLGTLHGIVFVKNIDKINVLEQGNKICHHEMFPKYINVNFTEVVNKNHLKVKTYERGVGPTLSCGTGVSSTATVTASLGLTSNKVKVEVPGGMLQVEVGKTTILTGPTQVVAKIDYMGGK
jgi:diaminopimelate epimerase